MNTDAALREWQRDPARADAELEGASASSELGQEVDCRLDDGRVEHVGARLVVPRRNPLAKVVLGHRQSLASSVSQIHGRWAEAASKPSASRM